MNDKRDQVTAAWLELIRRQNERLRPENIPPPPPPPPPEDKPQPPRLPPTEAEPRRRVGRTVTQRVFLTAIWLVAAWLIFTYTSWHAWTWITCLAAAAVSASTTLSKALTELVGFIGELLEGLASLLRILIVLAGAGVIIALIVYAVIGSPF